MLYLSFIFHVSPGCLSPDHAPFCCPEPESTNHLRQEDERGEWEETTRFLPEYLSRMRS